MHLTLHKTLLPAATIVILISSACSALLRFDPDGAYCSESEKCRPGFSCNKSKEECVEDGSLPEMERCTLTQQCSGDMACIDRKCHHECTKVLAPDDDCPNDRVCVRGIRTEEDAPLSSTGMCEANQCNTNSDCTGKVAGTSCVELDDGISRCLKTCSVSCSANGGCTESDCDPASETCQPIFDNRVMACMLIPETPGVQGEPCDFITQFCGPGYACIRKLVGGSATGTCLARCDTDAEEPCVGVENFTCPAEPCCREVVPDASFGTCGSTQ